MKTVFITGATAGFGEACAIKYAQNGFGLILNGRRKERLEALKEKLEEEYGITSYLLPFDVQNKEEVFSAVKCLPDEWKKIDILINNAGLALGRDSFENADLTDWETNNNMDAGDLLFLKNDSQILRCKMAG